MRNLVMLTTTSLLAAFVVWLFSFGFHTSSLFAERAAVGPPAAHAISPRPQGSGRPSPAGNLLAAVEPGFAAR